MKIRRFLRAFCLGLLALGVSAGSAAAADGLSAPKLEPTTSGQPAIEAEAEPVTQPVVDAVEPIVEVAEPVIEPVTQPVVDAVEPIVEVAEPVIEPVTKPVIDALEPIAEGADPALEPVRPIVDALEPIVEVADPVLDPALEPVRPIIDGVGPIADVADPLLEPYNPHPLPGTAPQPLTGDPARLVPDPGYSSSPTVPEARVDAGSVAKTATPQSTVPVAEPSLTRLNGLAPPFSRNQVAQMAGITLAIGGALWVALFGLGLLAPPFRAGRRPWVDPLLLRGLVPIPAVPPG